MPELNQPFHYAKVKNIPVPRKIPIFAALIPVKWLKIII